MTNGKFTFTGQPKFEIDEDDAAAILADPFPNKALDDWLIRQHPQSDSENAGVCDRNRNECWELKEMRVAFGNYLAHKKVAERKQLAAININPDDPPNPNPQQPE
jgi:hypothetical protein